MNMLMKLRIYKIWGISVQAEEMLAFQEGLLLHGVSELCAYIHACVCVCVCVCHLCVYVYVCVDVFSASMQVIPYIVTSEQIPIYVKFGMNPTLWESILP
jgi:hypothetical protein